MERETLRRLELLNQLSLTETEKQSVSEFIDSRYEELEEFDLGDALEVISNVEIPNAVEEIRTAPVLHDTVCETEDMQKTVETILGL